MTGSRATLILFLQSSYMATHWTLLYWQTNGTYESLRYPTPILFWKSDANVWYWNQHNMCAETSIAQI